MTRHELDLQQLPAWDNAITGSVWVCTCGQLFVATCHPISRGNK